MGISGAVFIYIYLMTILILYRLIGIAFASLTVISCSTLMGEPDSQRLDQDEEKVVGLPPGYSQGASPAYKGPHPGTFNRPQESFFFPIQIGDTGPVKPLFAGKLQYPFLCQTEESHFGQPLVDNQDAVGIPIYALDSNGDKTKSRIGYSKDCSLLTSIQYYYNRKGGKRFYPLAQANNDINQIEINGKLQDFVVRIETGTINRFIYIIATFKGAADELAKADLSDWNRVLIYQFNGGIGIGFNQGKIKVNKLLKRRYTQLAKGYAVAYSTGNETDNHYNVWLQEDTALRLKKQFELAYAKPEYTVGIGGSGGGLQQYLLAQNRPGLLDAAIPQYSYPDMITQTVYALDCDPLEYYFDITDRHNDYWQHWENRSKIEGLNAISMDDPPYSFAYRMSKLMNGYWPSAPTGSSECAQAWRGPAQVVLNPRFSVNYKRYSKSVFRNTHWTHWDDAKDIYGVGSNGYALSTWDNIGVQYGLAALTSGDISVGSFMELNKKVGGWRHAEQMKKARFWRVDGRTDILDFSLWSHHNINLKTKHGKPAPRTLGNLAAIEAAYRSGMIFMGKIDIPVIDIRHYLDGELDMHHSFASLASRQRIIGFDGDASEHVIWVAHKNYNITDQAFDTMHQWMRSRDKDTPGERPTLTVDGCFNAAGDVIALGETVWDGQWNGRSDGICTKTYPPFKTSRQVAGEDVKGMVLKCQLQSVDSAIEKGLYAPIEMNAHRKKMKVLFPQGVCDYSKPGMGLPRMLFKQPIQWVKKSDEANQKIGDAATDDNATVVMIESETSLP